MAFWNRKKEEYTGEEHSQSLYEEDYDDEEVEEQMDEPVEENTDTDVGERDIATTPVEPQENSETFSNAPEPAAASVIKDYLGNEYASQEEMFAAYKQRYMEGTAPMPEMGGVSVSSPLADPNPSSVEDQADTEANSESQTIQRTESGDVNDHPAIFDGSEEDQPTIEGGKTVTDDDVPLEDKSEPPSKSEKTFELLTLKPVMRYSIVHFFDPNRPENRGKEEAEQYSYGVVISTNSYNENKNTFVVARISPFSVGDLAYRTIVAVQWYSTFPSGYIDCADILRIDAASIDFVCDTLRDEDQTRLNYAIDWLFTLEANDIIPDNR